jgi:putative effector of murein hydrolase LrgA (UPF0299 family)
MYALLEKLGQHPKDSLKLFLRGIGLFFIAALLIVLGYFHNHLWQVAGIVVLVLASFISVWGYVGMFANRWLNILYRSKINSKNTTKW